LIKKAKELSAGEKDIEKLISALLKVIPEKSEGDFIVRMNLKDRYLISNEKEQIGDN